MQIKLVHHKVKYYFLLTMIKKKLRFKLILFQGDSIQYPPSNLLYQLLRKGYFQSKLIFAAYKIFHETGDDSHFNYYRSKVADKLLDYAMEMNQYE